MTSLPDDRIILSAIEPLVLDAGRRIVEIASEGFRAEIKADESPVTRADREAEAILLSGLRRQFHAIPIVAEEEDSAGLAPRETGDVFFLVDPLDGTREFVRGGDDYTVNVALVRGGVPVVGAVYAPACRQLYLGRPGFAELVEADAGHRPLARRGIGVRQPSAPLIVVASRSHGSPATEDYIARLGSVERTSIGSSLKFCLLAAGKADLYPRMGRTMQWDTAAGDAVLRAAGGLTRRLDGAVLGYGAGTVAGDEPFANPHFIAEGGHGGAAAPRGTDAALACSDGA
ncbi:MAG: 3'(2'),5'-bisphosphate nucleotidase CysQ [Aquamicrobium sp.]|uniref:3'(2'),5'-bisphosphate nucleotidase CysQ n=1 Tax=Aquamicrobium sp. TaxID=1872579 RepID=UPI00349EDABA|nr:3'(2'),5'-bisphosphate nucleotidase CysQ [Aquamicrobium sp.]